MVKCAQCEDELEYLPFSCGFCGNKFCKKHRLPENHNCSFEFQQDRYLVKNASFQTDEVSDMKYEPPKQEDKPFQNFKLDRNYDRPSKESRSFSPFSNAPGLRATYSIMIINVVFFLVVVVLDIIDVTILDARKAALGPEAYALFEESYTYLTEYLTLNAADYTLQNLRFYTIITAMFIPSDILSLIFNMLILYSVGKLIEGRFGSKVFIQIYIISGLITGAMVILCQLLFNTLNYEHVFEFGFMTTSGAILGLITFMMFLLPSGEIFLFSFRVKTRNLIWIFVGFYVVVGVISQLLYKPISEEGILNFPSFILYYASVFGVLGGYLTVRKFMGPQTVPYM